MNILKRTDLYKMLDQLAEEASHKSAWWVGIVIGGGMLFLAVVSYLIWYKPN